jgi:hypothetical protein
LTAEELERVVARVREIDAEIGLSSEVADAAPRYVTARPSQPPSAIPGPARNSTGVPCGLMVVELASRHTRYFLQFDESRSSPSIRD